MAVTSNEFVAAMRQYSASVNIITTSDGTGRAGLTATAVFSLTAEPPQIAIAVNRSASAYPMLVRAGCFCVNTLGAGHEDLASRFAGPIKGEERFEEGKWGHLATGAPALEGALVALDCVTVQAVEFSTHTLFVGKVETIRHGVPSKPLLFVDGQWASLLPATPAQVEHADGFMRRSISAIDEAVSTQPSPVDALDSFVRAFTKLNIAERRATREHLGAELYALPSILDGVFSATRDFDDKVLALLREGIERGDFDVDDDRIASFAIIGMIVWTFKWYRRQGRLTEDEVAARLAEYARRVVGASRPVPTHTLKERRLP